MGFFDFLKKKDTKNNDSSNDVIAPKSSNKAVTFTFDAIPQTVEELKALPEASMDTPFKTTALTMLALLVYEKNQKLCFEMLDSLRGPSPLSNYDKQFLQERLNGKEYKPRSFFAGTNPANNYTPNKPYKITVEDNPYSYTDEVYATMHITSSGADSKRQIKLRKKPSTGQWFLTDIQCLSDIRIPTKDDVWA